MDKEVSIAGAILFGVLPREPTKAIRLSDCFNRGGDSFWGAAVAVVALLRAAWEVSIAGAILFGVLLDPLCILLSGVGVSIAGAILFGVLHIITPLSGVFNRVSIAGAILFGVLHTDKRR